MRRVIDERKAERFSESNERDLLGVLLNAKEVNGTRKKEKKEKEGKG